MLTHRRPWLAVVASLATSALIVLMDLLLRW
jgi:hypothetical protein